METDPVLRLLLVDDDRFALTVLGDRLRARAHQVVEVESGMAALEQPLDAFDAIVCDFVMPRMNGAELLRRVREERRSAVPFFFVTSTRQPQELVRAALSLDADFLPKPVEVSHLIALVLERKRQPGRGRAASA